MGYNVEAICRLYDKIRGIVKLPPTYKTPYNKGMVGGVKPIKGQCGGYNRLLTYEQAQEIRKLSSTTNLLQIQIAEMFGVSRQVIYGITSGKQYLSKHVLDNENDNKI